jgi:hypothetical protein
MQDITLAAPPSLTLPHKGEGDEKTCSTIIPSPLRGEGREGVEQLLLSLRSLAIHARL